MNKKSKRGGFCERRHSTGGAEKSAVMVEFDTFRGWFFCPKNVFFSIFGVFFGLFCVFPLWPASRASRVARALFLNSTTSFPFLQSTFETPQKTHICPPSQWQTDQQDIIKNPIDLHSHPAIPKRSHVSNTKKSPRMGGHDIKRKASKQQRF